MDESYYDESVDIRDEFESEMYKMNHSCEDYESSLYEGNYSED